MVSKRSRSESERGIRRPPPRVQFTYQQLQFALLPSLPTLDESGLRGYDMVAYVGILGPAGLPKAIVDKLNTVIANVAKEPATKESVQKQGMQVEASSHEHFAKFLHESIAQMARLGKEANIKLE